MTEPDRKALTGLMALLAVMAAAIFTAAGTVRYWQAWLYLALFFGSTLATTLDLMKRDPALLARRSKGGPFAESSSAQKIIMSFAMIGFIALLVVPGLDRRFGWSHVPGLVALFADVAFVASYAAIGAVFRANTFAAATVGVEAGQRVISTGPYAVVRHPMYAAGTVLLAASPIALGSWWGLAAMIPLAPTLIWRLLDEEAVLKKELPGYVAYCARTKFRLVPGVW